MGHMRNISKLYQSKKTVFDLGSTKLILWLKNDYSARNAIHRMIKRWELHMIRPGYRWLPDRNPYELANMMVKPSYISLETVLSKAGIVFQSYQNTFFSISMRSKTISLPETHFHFQYHKIKDTILLNTLWIEQKWMYAIASPERALCDRIYLTPQYYFDNLKSIDWEFCIEIAKIYENKKLLSDIIHLSHASGY